MRNFGHNSRAFVQGLSWTVVLRFVVRGVAVIRSVALARLLDPAGFGIFGIAVMVLALLELMTETGINIFFLQNRDKIDKYLDTAWAISIIRGLSIAVLVLLITFPVTEFFNAPSARPLLLLMAIIPIIRGFLNPSTIKFQRNLEFHREFVYRGTITVMETAAMIGFTWWLNNPIGLVMGLITAGLTEVVMSYLLIKPWPKFKLIGSQVRDIISSGKWVTGFIVLDYMFTQTDNIVVGKLLGTAPLGIYRMSYTLSTLPVTEISDVFYKVAFPTFSKMITEKKNLGKAIKTIVLTICILTTLGGLGIWFLADYITFFLGPKWVAAVPVIKVLAFLGIIRSFSFSFNSVFMAFGKQKYVTTILFVSVLGLLVTIVPLVSNFGLLGAGYSAIIGAALSLPVAVILFIRTLNGLR